MAEWDTEEIAYSDHEVVHGLELDDGTYLDCYETVLVNEYGDEETFENWPGKREMRWWGWGPYEMTAILTADTIQQMFDDGALRVKDE